jgi:hypothetical protein
MTYDHTTGIINWTPSYDRTNSGSLHYDAYTSDGSTATQDWTVAVSFVTPSITNSPAVVATEGTLYSFTPDATVVDLYRYDITGAPTGMTLDSTTGIINWTPSYDRTNSGPLTLTLRSLNGLTDHKDWTVAVSYVTPSITNSPGTDATEGTLYSYTPTATVVDLFQYDLTGAPAGMTVNSTSGAINWTPPYDTTNSGPLTLTLRSLNGLTDHKDWTVAVTPLANVVIDVQPVSQNVQQGNALILSVTAHGTGTLHYQWNHNGTNVGTDSNTYTKTEFNEADRGSYYVTITDLSGPVTSDTVTASMHVTASSDRGQASRTTGNNTVYDYQSAWWLR